MRRSAAVSASLLRASCLRGSLCLARPPARTADDPPRGHGGPRGARRPHGHGGGSRLAGQRHVEQFDGIAADVDRFGGRAAEVHDHRGQRQPMVQ
ncbi:unnamed protein product [Prorocentrum cordatum]|uniref:Secreted protein n=1 Tax=Prorocentrum cordatum TaxID=2364126 RepID=A0ABN9USW2_9DINO|nr:unnamed protein product [Polarella glacialis]